MCRTKILSLASAALAFGIAHGSYAQQAGVSVGAQAAGDGFFEGINVGFGAAGRNGFFNNGGAAMPQFGGFNQGAGAGFGFGLNFPGGNGFVGIGGAQGSTRSISSGAASLTMMDGVPGSIAAVTQVPFVIGFTPVVGGLGGGIGGGAAGGIGGFGPGGQFGPMASQQASQGPSLLGERLDRIQQAGGLKSGGSGSLPSAAIPHDKLTVNRDDPAIAKLAAAQQSSAGQPAASIAQIRKQQSADDKAQSQEIQSLLDQGQKAQAAGKPRVARIFYQQAISRASGPLKEQAEAALRSLGDATGSR
jgi:hypothetical protein